ncbi:MAG: hypothetical protein D3906_00570 [Candidatus Electrothrix sp. AUS1_2]|nr:hypothetical protein [Candidatus Electrothrix sp. AUS1_2]
MIDYTNVGTAITTAVLDLLNGGVIIIGAYTGYFAVKRVQALFASDSFRSKLASLKKSKPLIGHPRKNRNRKARRSGLSFSVSFGSFSFSAGSRSVGSHPSRSPYRKRERSYKSYSGGRVSRHRGVSSAGYFGPGWSSYRDSFNSLGSVASAVSSSPSLATERFAPSPANERFSPSPAGDRFAPPPADDRFAPPPADDRFAPPPDDGYYRP